MKKINLDAAMSKKVLAFPSYFKSDYLCEYKRKKTESTCS